LPFPLELLEWLLLDDCEGDEEETTLRDTFMVSPLDEDEDSWLLL